MSNVDYDSIFINLATSKKSLSTICKEIGIPFNTIWSAISRNQELQEKEARARESQADFIVNSIFDELQHCYEIVMNPDIDNVTKHSMVNYSRLLIDSFKWIACKFRPNLYGDKIEVAHNLDAIQDKFKQLFSSATISDNSKATIPSIAQVTSQQQIPDQILTDTNNVIEIQPNNNVI